MKLQQNFVIEFTDEDFLEIINEEQEFYELEKFDTLEEIPDQLIGLYLAESSIFADIFYDDYVYDADQVIIIR
jgi:hypothetical protein